MSEPLAEYDAEHCPVCHGALELEYCWTCLGKGGHHDCGEDTCTCLDPYEVTETCEECDGKGQYFVCPAAEHHPREGEA